MLTENDERTSLPLPQQLKDLLPPNLLYVLIKFSPETSFVDEPRFFAMFRTTIISKKQCEEWMNDFMNSSCMTWRVRKTWPEHTNRLIFKKQYRCQHNTMPRAAIKDPHAKHTKCPAKVTVTIQQHFKRSKDPHVNKYPCIITFDNTHNHSVFDATSLSQRDPSSEVREKFIQMFSSLLPSAALCVHKQDLQCLHKEDYSKIVADRYHCPDLRWVYRLYHSIRKEIYRKDDGTEMDEEVFWISQETNGVGSNTESPRNEQKVDNNLKTTCRACLSNNSEVSYIIDEWLVNSYFLLTGIKIEADDLTTFCNQCFDKLNAFEDFRNVCLKSESVLQQKKNTMKECVMKSTNENPQHVEVIDLVKYQDVATTTNSVKNFNIKSDNKIVKKRFKCKECTKWFYTKERLDGHRRIHKGKKQAVCKKCGNEFINWSTLKEHMLQHTEPKRFVCDKCGMRFSNQWSLKVHDRVKHLKLSMEKSTCDICGKLFSSKSNLMSHVMAVHYENKVYSCRLCDKFFKSKDALKHHCWRHGKIKRYICKQCNKQFFTLYELKRHVSIHSEDRPFKCDLCRRPFKRKLFLINHMKKHLGRKSHVCIICRKSFASAHTLKEHRRTHTGEKPLRCSLCQRAFAQRNVLQVHLKSCARSYRPDIENI